MDPYFFRVYARQKEMEIAEDFRRIHLAAARPGLLTALLNHLGRALVRLGNRLQNRYALSGSLKQADI